MDIPYTLNMIDVIFFLKKKSYLMNRLSTAVPFTQSEFEKCMSLRNVLV